MEVSIISDQFIMPSCGTHKHPDTHLLSFIDQTISALVPILLFYSSGEIHVDDDMIKKRVQSLKQSLSKTLASFYPLAGRFSDDKKSIVCSDEGVYFVEASVNSNLSTFLQRPDLFHKLIPAAASDNNNIVGVVQVTRFTCGGMAIGSSISHALVDASAYSFFLRSWATTANDHIEHCQLSAPNFDSSMAFPPTDSSSSSESSTNAKSPILRRGRSVTKRVVFDAEAIVSLKAKASIPTCKQSPSRVEAVSALICKATAAAMRARSGKTKPLYTTFTVNMRRRANPSFPESCMGNYAALATVALGTVDQDTELADLVVKTREEINKSYNSDFVKSLRGEPAKLFELYKEKRVSAHGTVHSPEPGFEHICFNSCCNMGFYDIDFGWGKPIWVTAPDPVRKNQVGEEYFNGVFLMDTRSRDGSVEALITCHEEEICMMEQDKEFIAFATFQSQPPI